MTIQIIYAEIFHNVLRKIPGHIVGGWLCDLEASLWFLKFRPWLCILLSFTCRHSIFSDWSFILFPWLFHCFWLLQKCCCLSKFQEESFWEDIPSVRARWMRAAPSVNIAGIVCVVCIQTRYRIVSFSVTSSHRNESQTMFKLPYSCNHFTC